MTTPPDLDIVGVGLRVSEPTQEGLWCRQAGFDDATMGLITFCHDPEIGPPRANSEIGAYHICLRTADIEQAHARLERAGAVFTTSPQTVRAGLVMAYFRDPTGLQFQLLQVAAGPLSMTPTPPPIDRAVGTFHHIGLTVSNLDDAIGWFERTLSLRTIVRTGTSGEPASAMLGLDDASYQAAVLAVGNYAIELMEFTRPSPATTSPPRSSCEIVISARGDRVARRRLTRGITDGDLVRASGPAGITVAIRDPSATTTTCDWTIQRRRPGK